jgi:3-dehydroquinate dehydratase
LHELFEYHATGVPSVLVSILDALAVKEEGTLERYISNVSKRPTVRNQTLTPSSASSQT